MACNNDCRSLFSVLKPLVQLWEARACTVQHHVGADGNNNTLCALFVDR